MEMKFKVAIALLGGPGLIMLGLGFFIGQLSAYIGVGFMAGALVTLFLGKSNPKSKDAAGNDLVNEEFFENK